MLFNCKPLLLLCFVAFTCCFTACSPVKNAPKEKPFVYDNKIVLYTDAKGDAKTQMLTDLQNYWDDSLKVKRVNKFFLPQIKDPQVLDTANLSRTEAYMNAYLQSQGYYSAQFHRDSSTIKIDSTKVPGQKRATVTVNITTGKNLRIDSTGINITDTTLQTLAAANFKKSLLKKGEAVTTQIIGSELDRNVNIFRQNGYYLFSRENLAADVDTLDDVFKDLVSDSFVIPDPFELAIKAQQAAERRLKNPTADVLISLASQLKNFSPDTSYLKKFYVKNVYYYPDIQQYDDSIITNKRFKVTEYGRGNFYIKDTTNKFKYRPLREHTNLRSGDLYDDRNYYKTLNSLGQVGAWQQVDARGVIDTTAPNKDSVDFHIFLVPYKKYSFSADLEVSSSSSSDKLASSNFIGITPSFTLRNRNAWHRAIQTATVARAGVELNLERNENKLVQTLLFSLGHTISWPRIISPVPVKRQSRFETAKTLLSVNASYSDRLDFFRLKSLNAGFGYESSKKNKKDNLGIFTRRLNIELYKLDTLSKLRDAFVTNPFLRSAFNTGYIAGLQGGYSIAWPGIKKINTTHSIRVGAEESGLLFGRIPGLADKIYQYIKLDAEYKRSIQFTKTSIALRGYAGFGYNLKSKGENGKVLPFFKQFIAGGPNSMRGWQLRQLGLGSSVLSDTASGFRDRFGDIQLEANAEYRFRVFRFGSTFNIESAFFVDAGNIWNLREDVANPKSEFKLNRFANDIALAAGTGLRLNFSYFIVRLDFGFKLKNPARKEQNGWLLPDFTWQNKEYGIDRNNYALQVGIGMPF